MLTRLHPRMSRTRLAQGEGLIHHRAQFAAFNQGPGMLVNLVRQHRFKLVTARTQGRSGHNDPLHHDLGHVELSLRPAQNRDGHMAPIFAKAIDIAHGVIARDHIEHHIGALALGKGAHFLGEILRFVIDRQISAQFPGRGAFCIAAASGDDSQIESLAQHNRHGPDPAGPAMNQQSFAILGPAPLKHIVPNGEQGFRQSSRLGQGNLVRHSKTMRCWNLAIFGIGTARCKSANPLAKHIWRSVGPGRDHFSGKLEAQNR